MQMDISTVEEENVEWCSLRYFQDAELSAEQVAGR